MSQQITPAFTQQYNANLMHLSQQKGSKLRNAVRKESQKGKSEFYDRLGQNTAVVRSSRHADTPQIDSLHSRRRVTLVDYEWADLIDDQDKIRMLINPQSEYVVAAMWALGRAIDDVIIAAATGTAYGDETGSTSVVLPDTQKYAANDGTSFTNLNIDTLRAVKRMFDANDVDESIPRFWVLGSRQLESLLGQTEVTSSDFASVKALVQGEVDSFMGFKFIRTERLTGSVTYTASASTGAVGSGTSSTGNRKNFAFAMDGLLLAIGEDMVSKIDPRPDKGYATQVYARMSVGSTRMEEVKVVEVGCKES